MTQRVALAAVLVTAAALATVGLVAPTALASDGVPAVGTASDAPADGNASDAPADGNASDAGVPVGQDLAALVQTTGVGLSGAVEDGVFEERYERTNRSQRAALVENRTTVLERRADRVEAQLADLQNASDRDSPAYRARAAATAARLRALNHSADLTAERADAAGVDEERLRTLRERADELSGREIARIARDLGGLPGAPPRGPPDDRGRGPPTNASDRGQPTDGNPGRGTPAEGGDDGDGEDDADGDPGGGPPADGADGDDGEEDGDDDPGRGPPADGADGGDGGDGEEDGDDDPGRGPPADGTDGGDGDDGADPETSTSDD